MTRFEPIGILIAVVGVGVALAGLIINGLSAIRVEARADRAEAQAARGAMRAEARADRVQFQTEIKHLLERQGKVEGLVEGLTLVAPSQ